MSNLIQLDRYRHTARKSYINRHRSKVEQFVKRFVETHLELDFDSRTIA
jgi:hypothetical protein